MNPRKGPYFLRNLPELPDDSSIDESRHLDLTFIDWTGLDIMATLSGTERIRSLSTKPR